MKINWKEVWKFLAGVVLGAAAMNVYLFTNKVSVPFLGHTINSSLLGWKALFQIILVIILAYFGYRKESTSVAPSFS